MFGNLNDESMGVVGEGAYAGFVELFVEGSRTADFEEEGVYESSVAGGVLYSEFSLFLNLAFVVIFAAVVGSIFIIFVIAAIIVGYGGVIVMMFELIFCTLCPLWTCNQCKNVELRRF